VDEATVGGEGEDTAKVMLLTTRDMTHARHAIFIPSTTKR